MEDQDKVEPKEIVKDEPVEVKPVKDKKKVNKPAIFFGIVALMLAGVSVFFGIEYFKPKEEPEPVTVEKIEKEVKVEIAKETMAEDYKEVEDVMKAVASGVGNDDRRYFENGSGLPYKPDGFDTFVTMRLDIMTEIVDRNLTDPNALGSNMNTIKIRLENAGFSSLGILPRLGSAGPQAYGYLNTGRNIICSVSEGAESGNYGVVNYYYVLLECAKTDWIWLTEEEKSLVYDLTTAYYEKEGEYPDILYNFDNIKNSQYEPYQTLMVGVSGAHAEFYRVSPDAKWQFFTAGQAAPDCSEYNTEDLKKAYLGEVCYEYGNGYSKQSTVQL